MFSKKATKFRYISHVFFKIGSGTGIKIRGDFFPNVVDFSESINLTNEVQKYLGLYLGTQKLVKKVITYHFLTKQLCNANPSLEITQFGPKVVLTFDINKKFGVRLCNLILGKDWQYILQTFNYFG